MKVEIINENRVQIILTIDELSQRNVSLKDIEKDSKKARNLFLELIEESELESNFSFEHSQVFVEASTDSNNEFIVTITKVEDFPDLNKFDILNNRKIENNYNYLSYYSHFNIYEFSSLNVIIKLAKILKNCNYYIGKNSLYKYNNSYFLIFNSNVVKNIKFLKTSALLNEYCENIYETGIYETTLKEKSKLIIPEKALQKLIKI